MSDPYTNQPIYGNVDNNSFQQDTDFGPVIVKALGPNFIFILFVLFSIISLVLVIYTNENSVPADYIQTSDEYDQVTTILEWVFYFIGLSLIVLSWYLLHQRASDGSMGRLAITASFVLGSIFVWISVIQKQYRGYFMNSGMDIGIHVIQIVALVCGMTCLYYMPKGGSSASTSSAQSV